MTDEPTVRWAVLTPAWTAAFEQAWRSFGEGNFGVGATLTDPSRSGSPVVSLGRNLVTIPAPADQPLAGNYMAHAEMNAFAALRSYDARGLRLASTLEPCLMCAATGIFLNVASIEFAARDEFYEQFTERLWPHHPYTRARQPSVAQAIHGRLSAFARLLPLIHTLATTPDSRPAAVARAARPRLAALAESRVAYELRSSASRGRAVADVVADLWAELPLED